MEQLPYYLSYPQLQIMIDKLLAKGFDCYGPQVRDGAIIYDHLTKVDQLPWQIQDVQAPGSYRLKKIDSKQAFAWSSAAQSIKPLLFKTSETIWRVKRDKQGKLNFESVQPQPNPIALFGAKACDIHGMVIQDKAFLGKDYQDVRYKDRRNQLFIIAMSCTYSSENCFCVSAGGYPKAKEHFDISMTELEDGFVVEIGSRQGEILVNELQLPYAHRDKYEQALNRIAHAARSQTKTLPYHNSRKLRDVLFNNLEHPRWDNVAERCLSCANCTLVCPTCFCASETAKSNLKGDEVNHERNWDSCFTAQHSYIHKSVIRDDTRKRYRQWLTHKLGSWHDQFDTSGCVGCGRCITWCPVGIDITEEAHAINED